MEERSIMMRSTMVFTVAILVGFTLTSDLQAQLPTRVGVEVSIFGDRIVLLEASGLVVDILEGIFS